MCAPGGATKQGGRLASTVWTILAICLIWGGLRTMAHYNWDQRPLRRYTNWNLIIYGVCLVELLLRQGRSYLAPFVTTNSIAICASFYIGVLGLDFEIFVDWAKVELQALASTGVVDAHQAEEDLMHSISESEEDSWMPFGSVWAKVYPEIADGIDHPLEFAAAFHVGSFLIHVVPAIVAWRYLRPRAALVMPWTILGAVSSSFHLVWALSVAGSLYLNEVYFNAPNEVWWACWVSGTIAHCASAYLIVAVAGSGAAAKKAAKKSRRKAPRDEPVPTRRSARLRRKAAMRD